MPIRMISCSILLQRVNAQLDVATASTARTLRRIEGALVKLGGGLRVVGEVQERAIPSGSSFKHRPRMEVPQHCAAPTSQRRRVQMRV
jgi:hypothetical protein